MVLSTVPTLLRLILQLDCQEHMGVTLSTAGNTMTSNLIYFRKQEAFWVAKVLPVALRALLTA
jgi:hypothetical protein